MVLTAHVKDKRWGGCQAQGHGRSHKKQQELGAEEGSGAQLHPADNAEPLSVPSMVTNRPFQLETVLGLQHGGRINMVHTPGKKQPGVRK